MLKKTIFLILLFIQISLNVLAQDFSFVIAPALSHSAWKNATTLNINDSWQRGRYQLAGQVAIYSLLSREIFTGFQFNLIQNSSFTVNDLKTTIKTTNYSAISGLRYLYDDYETRLWWGLNYNNTTKKSTTNSNLTNWGPTWGISYGIYSQEHPGSWHLGIQYIPGYYKYTTNNNTEIPNRLLTYIAFEW